MKVVFRIPSLVVFLLCSIFHGYQVQARGLFFGDVDFTGTYSDPNHPGCVRVIRKIQDLENPNEVVITGTDGNPGCPTTNGSDEVPFILIGVVDGDKITIDFSPKGGPSGLVGTWETDPAGIRFPDDNKWTREEK